MSSSLRRGALAATTVALSIAVLSACGAGNDAETLGVRPDNASTTVGDIKIQNVNLVTSMEEDGPVGVSARLFNEGDRDQTLTDIRIPGVRGTVRLEPAEGKGGPEGLVVPAGGTLALGGEGNASAQIDDGQAAGIADGNAQRVVFDLSTTGEIELKATVVPATGAFRDHGPTSAPEEGPAPSSSPGAAGPEKSPSTGSGEDAEDPDAESTGQPGDGETDPAGQQDDEGGADSGTEAGAE